MDAPVHGGDWIQCLWTISAQNGQPVRHCSEQEPRTSWEDEASLSSLVLAQRCSSGWTDCTHLCCHRGHGCRHFHKVFRSPQSAEVCQDAWIGHNSRLWSLALTWGSVIVGCAMA